MYFISGRFLVHLPKDQRALHCQTHCAASRTLPDRRSRRIRILLRLRLPLLPFLRLAALLLLRPHQRVRPLRHRPHRGRLLKHTPPPCKHVQAWASIAHMPRLVLHLAAGQSTVALAIAHPLRRAPPSPLALSARPVRLASPSSTRHQRIHGASNNTFFASAEGLLPSATKPGPAPPHSPGRCRPDRLPA